MSQFIHRFHKAIVLVALILTALSVLAALRLRLNLSLFSLLPSNQPEVQRFFDITETVGFQSLLISVVETDEGIAPAIVTELLDTLAEQYGHIPQVTKVAYQQDPEPLDDLFSTLLSHMALLLPLESLTPLADKLTDESIRQKIQENRQILMTPLGPLGKKILSTDPLGMGELLLASVSLPFEHRDRLNSSGQYQLEGRSTFFIFLTPSEPPQDIDFSKKLMHDINGTEKQVRKDITVRYGIPQDSIRIQHTGGYPIAVQDEALTRMDIKITLITSLVCILTLFFISFRTPMVLLLVCLPLVMALVWTIGFAGLVFQQINILSCLFACVLLGLGIDFAIHMVNRFFDPHANGLSEIARLEYMFESAGAGTLMGGITTAVAFFAVGLSDFQGFRELGITTGAGLLFCLTAMMLVLPACLIWTASSGRFFNKAALAGFLLIPLMSAVRKYSRQILIVAGLCVGMLVTIGFQVGFDDNLKNVRPRDSQVLQLQEKVTSWLGGSSGAVWLTITDVSEEALMDKQAVILDALAPLKGQGDISRTISIGQLLPSPAQQKKNIAWLKKHPEQFDSQRIQESFERALDENGFRYDTRYEHYIKQLTQGFAKEAPLLPSDLWASRLKPILARLFLQKGDQFSTIMYLHPRADLWSYHDASEFQDGIVDSLLQAGVTPDEYQLTGVAILTGQLKRLILENLKDSMGMAILGIVLILWVYFRSLKDLFLSILPLLTGMAILVGMMVLLGIEFNFLNIMVVPMIIGIGIDDGIHFTHSFRHPSLGEDLKGLVQTGRAVVLTSLTTMAGFGSIILSHYPGLKSMGLVAVIGIAGCLFSSIVLMPAIFERLDLRSKIRQHE